MEQSNTFLNERMDHKDVDINISSVPDWNRLFIDKINPVFGNKLHNIKSDDVPHADE